MLVFKVSKITAFLLILGLVMGEYFKHSNITLARLELNFEGNNSTQRWQRVKEYISTVQDDHWQKHLRDVKQISDHSPLDGKISPYQKTWLYSRSRAKFSSVIFKDAQKPKKFQRSSFSKSPNKAPKRPSKGSLLT